jgi:cysteine synthase A
VPYALVAAVGTGGTVLGTGQYLKSVYPGIHIYPLELAGCPDSAGLPGRHPARGMGGEALPIKADLSLLDKVITVSGADSVMTAQKIRAELGLEVGASSGANLLGAIKVQLSTGSRDAVVTFFPDKPKGELALPKPAANADGHDMSPHITLTGFRTLGETGIKKANG